MEVHDEPRSGPSLSDEVKDQIESAIREDQGLTLQEPEVRTGFLVPSNLIMARSLLFSPMSFANLRQTNPTFWNHFESLEAGHNMRDFLMATTLQAIAKEGPEAFYNGSLTDDFMEAIINSGGQITRDDLAKYMPIRRPLIRVPFGSSSWVYTIGAPSGGPLLLAALRLYAKAYALQMPLPHQTVTEQTKGTSETENIATILKNFSVKYTPTEPTVPGPARVYVTPLPNENTNPLKKNAPLILNGDTKHVNTLAKFTDPQGNSKNQLHSQDINQWEIQSGQELGHAIIEPYKLKRSVLVSPLEREDNSSALEEEKTELDVDLDVADLDLLLKSVLTNGGYLLNNALVNFDGSKEEDSSLEAAQSHNHSEIDPPPHVFPAKANIPKPTLQHSDTSGQIQRVRREQLLGNGGSDNSPGSGKRPLSESVVAFVIPRRGIEGSEGEIHGNQGPESGIEPCGQRVILGSADAGYAAQVLIRMLIKGDPEFSKDPNEGYLIGVDPSSLLTSLKDKEPQEVDSELFQFFNHQPAGSNVAVVDTNELYVLTNGGYLLNNALVNFDGSKEEDSSLEAAQSHNHSEIDPPPHVFPAKANIPKPSLQHSDTSGQIQRVRREQLLGNGGSDNSPGSGKRPLSESVVAFVIPRRGIEGSEGEIHGNQGPESGIEPCGQRVILGSADAGYAAQVLIRMLIKGLPLVESIEATRIKPQAPPGNYGIEVGPESGKWNEESTSSNSFLLKGTHLLPPYPSVNGVQEIGDTLASHADSRGGESGKGKSRLPAEK
ncbi:hypothetical protein J437_LFUL016403 [Ladona fulva]|uniref:Uncharacterized protein n=1 Tax=Ladona fulva TaxID=123851 RepID=A0A8K0KK22_LADFU|nr:hypothetical protein J437_LFUL016403 [Ladona fulva]